MSSSPLLAGMPVMMPAAQAVLDMAAITHNLARLRARAPYSRVMAVIKANAYGHGLIRLAHALSEADAFAVARVEEGMALREAGVRQRIAVLGGFIVREELELYAGMHRLGFSQEEFDLWRRHGGDNRLHEPRFVTVDKLDGRMGRPRQRSCLSARSARPLR